MQFSRVTEKILTYFVIVWLLILIIVIPIQLYIVLREPGLFYEGLTTNEKATLLMGILVGPGLLFFLFAGMCFHIISSLRNPELKILKFFRRIIVLVVGAGALFIIWRWVFAEY